MPIPEKLLFGPLVAPSTEQHSSFPMKRGPRYCLGPNDGAWLELCLDSAECNWMKFVRFSGSLSAANMVAFRYEEKFYFVTVKSLVAGEEKMVTYAKSYADLITSGTEISADPEMQLENCVAFEESDSDSDGETDSFAAEIDLRKRPKNSLIRIFLEDSNSDGESSTNSGLPVRSRKLVSVQTPVTAIGLEEPDSNGESAANANVLPRKLIAVHAPVTAISLEESGSSGETDVAGDEMETDFFRSQPSDTSPRRLDSHPSEIVHPGDLATLYPCLIAQLTSRSSASSSHPTRTRLSGREPAAIAFHAGQMLAASSFHETSSSSSVAVNDASAEPTISQSVTGKRKSTAVPKTSKTQANIQSTSKEAKKRRLTLQRKSKKKAKSSSSSAKPRPKRPTGASSELTVNENTKRKSSGNEPRKRGKRNSELPDDALIFTPSQLELLQGFPTDLGQLQGVEQQDRWITEAGHDSGDEMSVVRNGHEWTTVGAANTVRDCFNDEFLTGETVEEQPEDSTEADNEVDPSLRCAYCQKPCETDMDRIIHQGHCSRNPMSKSRCVGICFYCDFAGDSVRRHVADTHMVEGRYPCREPNCDRTFDLYTDVRRHWDAAHDSERLTLGINTVKVRPSTNWMTEKEVLICKFCGKEYVGRRQRNRHQVVCIENPERDTTEYPCEFCGITKRSKASLFHHRKVCKSRPEGVVDVQRTFPCMYCGEEMPPGQLGKHYPLHRTDGKYKCPERCVNESFNNLDQLRTHWKYNHKFTQTAAAIARFRVASATPVPGATLKSDGYYCDTCGAHVTTVASEMEDHLQRNCAPDTVCLHCDQVFVSRVNLNYHINRFHSDKPVVRRRRTAPVHRNVRREDYTTFFFQCRDCKQGFRLREALVKHLDAVHPDKAKSAIPELNLPRRKWPSLKCMICRKVVLHEEHAQQHLKNIPNHNEEHLDKMTTDRGKPRGTLLNGYFEPVEASVYSCEVCEGVFDYVREFVHHARKEHPEYHNVLMPHIPPDHVYLIPSFSKRCKQAERNS